MALRTIRVQGDSVLTKKSRTVDKMTPRIGELITDMLDTMYEIPSDETISKCIITKEAVEGNAKPLLEYRTDAVKKAQ